MLQNEETYFEALKISRSCVYQEPCLGKAPFVACLRKWNKATRWICDSFVTGQHHSNIPEADTREKKPSSSFLLGTAQGASAQHTSHFPHSLEIPPAGINQHCGCKVSPPLLSPTPREPFIGFYCYKALKIHSPGCQQDKLGKNSTCLCSAQLTQDARTNLCHPH